MAGRRAAHSRRRAWVHMTRTVKVIEQPGGGSAGSGKAAKAAKAAKANKAS